jgi:myo-inositol 2-dehydrogenase/D-chiro-inositol 1-dehydrogenase
MASTIRYGIIGTGLMGLEHMRNIAIIPDAEVAAVADPHPRSQKWAARIAGDGLRIYDDYRQMLKEAPIDAVIIATPNFTHGEVLRDVFETDLAVLCEKPLCTTAEGCARVVDATADRLALFWVGMEYRYMLPVTRFVEEVRAGAAGRLRMLSIREHRFPFLQKVGDWNRFNRNTGGTLVEKSCHHFDLMRHVLRAEPARVFASGGMDVNHLDERYDSETPDIIDNAFVIVDFDNGARAMLDLCMFAEASPHAQELAATGDLGKVECLLPDCQVVVGTRQPRSIETYEVTVPEDAAKAGYHHGASYYQHLAFQRALREGTPPEVSARDGQVAVAMGLAAQRSIEEGRPVVMSEFAL